MYRLFKWTHITAHLVYPYCMYKHNGYMLHYKCVHLIINRTLIILFTYFVISLLMCGNRLGLLADQVGGRK